MSEWVDELNERLGETIFQPQEGIDQPYNPAARNGVDAINAQLDLDNDEDDDSYSDYDSDDSLDDELKLINAQLQWEESLNQLKTLVGFVILPLIGKMLGRKFAGISKLNELVV